MWSSLVTIFTTTKLQLLIFFPTFSYCISFFSEFPLLFSALERMLAPEEQHRGLERKSMIVMWNHQHHSKVGKNLTVESLSVSKSPLNGCEGVGSVGASRKSRASCGRIVMDLLQSSIPNAFFPSNVLGNICSCRS